MWQGEHETTQEVKARLAAATLSQIFGTFDMIWDYDDMIILYDVISYDMVWYDQKIFDIPNIYGRYDEKCEIVRVSTLFIPFW